MPTECDNCVVKSWGLGMVAEATNHGYLRVLVGLIHLSNFTPSKWHASIYLAHVTLTLASFHLGWLSGLLVPDIASPSSLQSNEGSTFLIS